MGNKFLEKLKRDARVGTLSQTSQDAITKYDSIHGAGASDKKIAEYKAPEAPKVEVPEVPKLVRATKNNPVVKRGIYEGAETPKLEWNKDTYDNIRVKGMLNPKELSKEEREFVARTQIKLQDGQDINSIFGIKTPKSKTMSDIDAYDIAAEFGDAGLYQMRGKLRQDGYSEEEIENISSHHRKYRQERHDALDPYFKKRTHLLQQQARDITSTTYKYDDLRRKEQELTERMKKNAQRQASLYGVGRSSMTEQVMAEMNKKSQSLINKYNLAEAQEKQLIEMQANEAEATELQEAQLRLDNLRNGILQEEKAMESDIQKQEAEMRSMYLNESRKLLADSGVDENEVDMEVTQQYGDGYFRNSEGKIILGKDNMPVEFKSLETKEVETAVDGFFERYKDFSMPYSRKGLIGAIKQGIASGYELGEIMDSLNEELQNSDDYINQKNKEFMGVEKVIDLGDSKRVHYKDGSYEDLRVTEENNRYMKLENNRIFDKQTQSFIQAPSKASVDRIMAEDGSYGGQCGTFASRATGTNHTPGGNSKKARREAFTDTNPVAGSLVFFDGEGYDKTYGHIAFVESVNEDGTLNITESNFNGDEKVSRRTIQASEATGFYNDTPFAQGGGRYSREAENYAKNIQNSGGDFKLVNVPEKFRAEVSNYLAENPKKLEGSDPVVQQIKQKLNITSSLFDDKWNGRAVSGKRKVSLTNFITGGKDNYLSKIQFLLDEQPLQQLLNIKAQGGTFGALSEKELGLLQASSSLLNSAAIRDEVGKISGFNMSEKDFFDNLKQLETYYTKAIQEKTGGVSSSDPLQVGESDNNPLGI